MKEIYEQNIKRLIAEKYKRIDDLPNKLKEEIIDQLFWVQENTKSTPQVNILYKGGDWHQHLHREIFRALDRIESMLLLHSVTEENKAELYQEFISKQAKNESLSQEDFTVLSQQFIKETDGQIETHIRDGIIASVVLSIQVGKITSGLLDVSKDRQADLSPRSFAREKERRFAAYR